MCIRDRHWAADFDNAASQEMVAAWTAKYPDRPITTYAQQSYDTAKLIASAFAKTGGVDDMEALRAALKSADFTSTRGNFAFGAVSYTHLDVYKRQDEWSDPGLPARKQKPRPCHSCG